MTTSPASLRRLGALCLGAAALALGAPAHASVCCLPDLENGFDAPNGSPVAYELDFYGDVTSYIPAQVSDDPFINPFAAMHDQFNKVLNPTVVFYDPTAHLTRVVLSGDALPSVVPANLQAPHYVINGVDSYHTGMNAGNVYNAAVSLASRHWIYGDGSNGELDALSLGWAGNVTKKTKTLVWLATFIRTVDPATGAPRSGAWRFTAYDGTTNLPFRITNDSEQPVIIDTIGFLPGIAGPADPECRKTPTCAGNQKALDTLAADAYPPPQDPGSRFQLAKTPPGAIPPHGTYSFKIR
jgi:hypothetical protein